MNCVETTTGPLINLIAEAAGKNDWALPMNLMAHNVKHTGNSGDQIQTFPWEQTTLLSRLEQKSQIQLFFPKVSSTLEAARLDDRKCLAKVTESDIFPSDTMLLRTATRLFLPCSLRKFSMDMIRRKILNEAFMHNFESWARLDAIMKTLIRVFVQIAGFIGSNVAPVKQRATEAMEKGLNSDPIVTKTLPSSSLCFLSSFTDTTSKEDSDVRWYCQKVPDQMNS